ncbi:hexosaminidase D-like isoform X3 [Achroia grisella]|uniref:hexosaminidase D-like isoform X3 n=1 Tax=Achroia grisella TaxID=688607 RepID=UPI0027D2B37B|nr:hexosaminidase D-like isoform X3 [Achroia grisella]
MNLTSCCDTSNKVSVLIIPFHNNMLFQVLLKAKSWGATAILIEWEDTFPYIGQLIEIGSLSNYNGDDMYTMDDVKHILKFAKNNGLEVIQLIQTIGHMEFVLKHPVYERLREVPQSPSVLCPSNPEAQSVVRMMLDQALQVQPDAKYLHIGADEAWHLAKCLDCETRIATRDYKLKECLYLDHIQSVATYLKQRRPDLTVLIWDDMLRPVDFDTLKSYQLGELVEPVVWDYNPLESFYLSPMIWSMYSQLFSQVWAASAYKGASGSNKMVAPVSRYVSNQEAWIKVIQTHSPTVKFGGIFLTGMIIMQLYASCCLCLCPVWRAASKCCARLVTFLMDF